MNILQGKTDCTPQEAGYHTRGLDALHAFCERMMEKKIIHGVSYRLARQGKVFAAAAMGSRHYRQADIAMQPDTVFGVASQTKAFVAVAIQILCEDGFLSIDDRAAKYLPQFDGAPYDEITLFHLLTHSSGLYPESGIPDRHHVGWRKHIEEQYKIDGDKTDWLSAGLRSGLRRKPGEEWQYCNFGYMILGEIIRVVSGQSARSFIEERICKPLGMTDSGFTLTPEPARRSMVFDEWSEQSIRAAEQGEQRDRGMWKLLPGTSGGLFSTTHDLMRFGRMLGAMGRWDGTRILGRKAVESMRTLSLTGVPNYCWGENKAERRYALGWDMRYVIGALPSMEAYFHEGAGASITIIDPKEDFVGVWLIPWVGDWNNDCSRRIINTVFSGII